MPICKNCEVQFPHKMMIDGKQKDLSNRSYCLKCSPWGQKKGYNLKKKELELSRSMCKKCNICKREFPWTKNNVCSTCRTMHHRHCQKLKGIEALGGKCSKCGENNHWFLTFHHLDPEKKNFALSTVWGSLKWDLLKEEIDKCTLLCLKCHRLEHLNDDKLLTIIEYYKTCPRDETGST